MSAPGGPTNGPTNASTDGSAGASDHDSNAVLDELYRGLGAVGAHLQAVHDELAALRDQLNARDEQLVKARLHAEQTGDSSGVEEVRAEQDEVRRALTAIEEHLGPQDSSSDTP